MRWSWPSTRSATPTTPTSRTTSSSSPRCSRTAWTTRACAISPSWRSTSARPTRPRLSWRWSARRRSGAVRPVRRTCRAWRLRTEPERTTAISWLTELRRQPWYRWPRFLWYAAVLSEEELRLAEPGLPAGSRSPLGRPPSPAPTRTLGGTGRGRQYAPVALRHPHPAPEGRRGAGDPDRPTACPSGSGSGLGSTSRASTSSSSTASPRAAARAAATRVACRGRSRPTTATCGCCPAARLWSGSRCRAPSYAGADLVVVEQANRQLVNYRLLLRSALRHRPRVVFWGHGGNLQASGPLAALGERIKRSLSRRAHWWLAYTEGSADRVAALGFPRDRITVVQNAVEVAPPASPPERVPGRCVYVGSLYSAQADRLPARRRPSYRRAPRRLPPRRGR